MRAPLSALLALLILAACGHGNGEDADGPGPPDVILLVIDTLRADHLSSYGHDRPTSPVLDRLAAGGVLCEDVTSQCSWTLPSMVSMFQGRYLTAYRDAYLDEVPTLAEVFRAQGYRTLGVVGNGLLSPRTGFDRGFDHYDARRAAPGPGRRSSPARTAGELLEAARGPLLRALETDADGRRPPLFAYLHFMDPHGPYDPHPDLESVLPSRPAAGRDRLARQRARYRAEGPAGGDGPGDGQGADPEEVWRGMGADLARYDQEVRHTDRHVGLVLELLEEHGAASNAIVAVVSDHGEGLWDHRCAAELRGRSDSSPRTYFQREHGRQLYSELIATPMILWGRGIPAGVRIPVPVENLDLFPTLVELAGLPPVAGLDGRSLVAAMGGAPLARRPLFSRILQASSVRDPTSGWKLIVPGRVELGREVELFQLTTDPGELANLAGAQPGVVSELRSRIEEWVAAHPTETNLGRPRSDQTLRDLRELGYVDGEEDEGDR